MDQAAEARRKGGADGGASLERLLSLHRSMLTIRLAEEKLGKLFQDGQIPGFIHLSTGQEATAVGVIAALNRDDTIASTHRGHGHALAKGMAPETFFLELLGRDEGLCRGRGGSLHVADFSVGMLGANGIVGAGIPIALGSALAHRTLGSRRVAAALFGDGALSEGVVYEALNLATLWSLPLLLVCENNGWSEFSPIEEQYKGSLAKLAASFGVRFARVDGNDVAEVFETAAEMVEMLRDSRGPALLECTTLRLGGHYQGDAQKYRKGRTEAAVDPLDRSSAGLAALGVEAGALAEMSASVEARLQAAVEAAMQGTPPAFEDAVDAVYARKAG